jgi:hypothetical protein
MTKKIVSLIAVLFIYSVFVQSQTIQFTYDENGNRIERVLVSQRLKSATIDFPVKDLKKLELADEKKDQLIDSETTLKVYPNPTKGLLRIEVSNIPEGASTQVKLYDYSGVELINQNDFPPSQVLDISRFKDGLYILRIIINSKVTNWKIIKNTK